MLSMAERVAAFDWALTPLGPRQAWPSELAAAVDIMLSSGFPAAVVWGPEFITLYNDAFRPILGDKPDALGRSFRDIWSEVWSDIAPIVHRAFAGQATYIENFPLDIRRRSHGPEQAWFTFSYSPIRLRDGAVGGFMDTVVETTEAVQARAEVDLLNAELGHRLKNTLSLVQSLASQTLRGHCEPAALDALDARLEALGGAHDVLLAGRWTRAALADVAAVSLAPWYGLRQISWSGPETEIAPEIALGLSLVLHELATNSAKYGALSSPGGQVRLDWSADRDDLLLHWRESGGPMVMPPLKLGAGSRLIDRAIPGARVDRRYSAAGFEADIRVEGRRT